jgi:hypothetical protein
MAYAYSPGLKILKTTTLHRERRLPIAGDVLVAKGDTVQAEQVVMKTELPGKADMVNIVAMLGCQPNEITRYAVKNDGDSIEEHELLAESSSFFGLFKTRIYSPLSGSVESISPLTGQVTLRGTPIPVEVKAYIDGTIIDITKNESVTVETTGAFAQGIFGVGGEVCGQIACAVSQPNQQLEPDMITPALADKIVVGGSMVTYDILQHAIKTGLRALIVGGFDDADLKKFLGFDLGVAITGHENLGLTLIITEGFGNIPMADKTFELLKNCQGMKASVNGATQIRAGVMRPEIIIPHTTSQPAIAEENAKLILEIGTRVRVIREPYFGVFGTIIDLPAQLTKLATESEARVLKLKLDDGSEVIFPRANVEVIATDV